MSRTTKGKETAEFLCGFNTATQICTELFNVESKHDDHVAKVTESTCHYYPRSISIFKTGIRLISRMCILGICFNFCNCSFSLNSATAHYGTDTAPLNSMEASLLTSMGTGSGPIILMLQPQIAANYLCRYFSEQD